MLRPTAVDVFPEEDYGSPKEDEKGLAAMCKVMEDMRNENTKQVMTNNIRNIMKNLKLTVEQAMDALSVPQSQREMYAGLVETEYYIRDG